MSPHEVYGILMGNLRSNKWDIFEIWDGLKIENPKILRVQMKRNNRIDVLYCASHRLGFLWLILTFTAPVFFVSHVFPKLLGTALLSLQVEPTNVHDTCLWPNQRSSRSHLHYISFLAKIHWSVKSLV